MPPGEPWICAGDELYFSTKWIIGLHFPEAWPAFETPHPTSFLLLPVKMPKGWKVGEVLAALSPQLLPPQTPPSPLVGRAFNSTVGWTVQEWSNVLASHQVKRNPCPGWDHSDLLRSFKLSDFELVCMCFKATKTG